MYLGNNFMDELLGKAESSERRRMNYDLRTSAEDSSQRMLNAILPESIVPIHRHRTTSESVVCLRGNLTEIFYEEVLSTNCTNSTNELKETARFELKPDCLLQIPAGTWHTVIANEPSVIFEAMDGAFAPAEACDVKSSN